MSLDDEDDVPLPVVPDVEPGDMPGVPDVPVPVVPVDPVPDVEPALLLVPPLPLDVLLPVPPIPVPPMPVLPMPVLPEVPEAPPDVLSVAPGVPVVDDDDDTGGGAGGVTTVVDELAPGVVADPVAGGESWRCWHAPRASNTLAATAVRIGRFIVAPG